MKHKSSRTGDMQNASPVAFDLHLTNKPKKPVLHPGSLFQINLMDKGVSFYRNGGAVSLGSRNKCVVLSHIR